MIGRRPFPDFFSTIRTVILPNLPCALSSTVCLIGMKLAMTQLMAEAGEVNDLGLEATTDILKRYIILCFLRPDTVLKVTWSAA
jgi:hypothetical protein